MGRLDIEQTLLQLAADIVELLRQIFGVDGTDHPLFRKLGLEAAAFEAAIEVLPIHLRVAGLEGAILRQLFYLPVTLGG